MTRKCNFFFSGLHYDDVSSHSFDDASVIILCYSIISPQSYDNICEKWLPAIQFLPNPVPVILLGTKSDLRTNQMLLERLARAGLEPKTEKDGKQLAKQISAIHFEEISLEFDSAFEDVSRVFQQASQAPMLGNKKKKNQEKCCVVV